MILPFTKERADDKTTKQVTETSFQSGQNQPKCSNEQEKLPPGMIIKLNYSLPPSLRLPESFSYPTFTFLSLVRFAKARRVLARGNHN